MSEKDAPLNEFSPRSGEYIEEKGSELHLPEVGEIPDDWSLVTVEDVSDDLLGGGTPSKSEDEFWGGDIPWASVKDLNGIELSETEDYITESGVENSATNVIPANSIIISTRMTVGEPFINKVEMAINQDMKAIIPDRQRANSLFLVYSLWDKDPYLKSLGRGTTVDGITTKDLLLTHLGLPPLEEQRKIASVLYTVDQAIQKTEEVIDQIERVQDGLLNDLINRGIGESGIPRPSFDESPSKYKEERRYTIPNDWDVTPLQDLCKEKITYGIVQAGPHVEDGIPYIKTGDMTDGELVKDKLSRTSEDIAEDYDRATIQTGELVITIRATVGVVKQVPSELHGANLTQGTARIAPNDSIDNEYLLWAIRSNAVQSMIEARLKGTTFDEITLGQLRQVPIPHPESIKEQQKIVEPLGVLSKRLKSEEKFQERLKNIKQGLMQDLLSGDVRTHDKDIEVVDEVLAHG